ncbi:MAG: indole-3-glycerol phosphate synthase TrpC [Candidatus Omnitrophota bacterium]
MILSDLLQKKRRDIEEMKRRIPLHRLRDVALHAKRSSVRSFAKAVKNPHGLNLICEIKKASPSEGVIREDFQPLRIASYYELGGASAISVLTEPHYFLGRPSYLRTIRQVTRLPILRKDFILESFQLYESAVLEADANLLIASLLTDEELRGLVGLGKELGMDSLVEVHTEEDLKKAIDSQAEILGINNRNLKTLEVDPSAAKRLIPHIPKGKTIVVESGLKQYEEILEYKGLGAHAFLIGTTLMRAENILTKLEELTGRDRKWRKAENGS